MNNKKYSMEEVCEILELEKKDYGLQRRQPKERAMETLEKFKSLVKKQYRVLIKKYHPDLPKNGVKEEEKLKDITLVVEFVSKLEIVQRRKPRRPVFVFTPNPGPGIRFRTSTSTTSGTTQDSTTFKFYFYNDND